MERNRFIQSLLKHKNYQRSKSSWTCIGEKFRYKYIQRNDAAKHLQTRESEATIATELKSQ